MRPPSSVYCVTPAITDRFRRQSSTTPSIFHMFGFEWKIFDKKRLREKKERLRRDFSEKFTIAIKSDASVFRSAPRTKVETPRAIETSKINIKLSLIRGKSTKVARAISSNLLELGLLTDKLFESFYWFFYYLLMDSFLISTFLKIHK